MIELVSQLKFRHGLNAYQIRRFCGFFHFLLLRPRPQARRGHLSAALDITQAPARQVV
jgi:hypothetical protein